LIDEYEAPDYLSDEIKDFLFESGHLYNIIELAKDIKQS